jgi:hypothetical protein
MTPASLLRVGYPFAPMPLRHKFSRSMIAAGETADFVEPIR